MSLYAKTAPQPPDDLPPAVVCALLKGMHDPNIIVAALMDLARRGVISVTKQAKGLQDLSGGEEAGSAGGALDGLGDMVSDELTEFREGFEQISAHATDAFEIGGAGSEKKTDDSEDTLFHYKNRDLPVSDFERLLLLNAFHDKKTVKLPVLRRGIGEGLVSLNKALIQEMARKDLILGYGYFVSGGDVGLIVYFFSLIPGLIGASWYLSSYESESFSLSLIATTITVVVMAVLISALPVLLIGLLNRFVSGIITISGGAALLLLYGDVPFAHPLGVSVIALGILLMFLSRLKPTSAIYILTLKGRSRKKRLRQFEHKFEQELQRQAFNVPAESWERWLPLAAAFGLGPHLIHSAGAAGAFAPDWFHSRPTADDPDQHESGASGTDSSSSFRPSGSLDGCFDGCGDGCGDGCSFAF